MVVYLSPPQSPSGPRSIRSSPRHGNDSYRPLEKLSPSPRGRTASPGPRLRDATEQCDKRKMEMHVASQWGWGGGVPGGAALSPTGAYGAMAVLPAVGGGYPLGAGFGGGYPLAGGEQRHEKRERSFLRPSTVPTGGGRASFADEVDDPAAPGGGGGGPLSVLAPGGDEARTAQSVIGERRRQAALRHTIRSGGAL